MINWKHAAKFFYSQFILWRNAYNEIANIYMIDESFSVGSNGETKVITYNVSLGKEVNDECIKIAQ